MTSSEGGSRIDRPFEGGFESTSGIFMVIYYHMLIPGTNLLQRSTIQLLVLRGTKQLKGRLFLSKAHTQVKVIFLQIINIYGYARIRTLDLEHWLAFD